MTRLSDTVGSGAGRFIDMMFRDAFAHQATDVHIEPGRNGYRIRLRVDGRLRIYRQNVPPSQCEPMVSRLKVLASLDIAESRQSQDGSFKLAHPLRPAAEVDVRVATAATSHGERMTLRLLGTGMDVVTVEQLGMDAAVEKCFRELIARPQGLLLVTGPTGSGKSTTLYTALGLLNREETNIVTVEDPIEYSLPGVSQMQVDAVGKVTFAKALRSILRHDPDILMVGEVRDHETAEIALRAAATGHLVLSTLHTNTAIAAVTRLVDMGCEPYMVASTLTACLSQRLVRRLCTKCRREVPPTARQRSLLGGTVTVLYEPVGCPHCEGTGYHGRVGVFELMVIDRAARQAIHNRCNEEQILGGTPLVRSLREDALTKVASGVTSWSEAAWVGRLEVTE
ncbi:MAG: type II/IV secretion system protein [Planctomycetes bacterium]|nr:type II/IV secretion system protein [Planctomycetota bacterium]